MSCIECEEEIRTSPTRKEIRRHLSILALKSEILGLMIWGMYNASYYISLRWGI